ncbi:farnesol dehydrogenase-like [Drosophila sulfurigaster albostrigata]|uniref:farnesol dehydrogenase-like n=1 Tax=Drosophila sulfurigaster albostrigata TaxID=89887 RepID=UPI002D21A08C|nr:farnesol dehydrogenase-like [Drosophila sulfurigaster albostrigata]
MNRWLNRVAVVTGASSGIGAACCKDLVSKGMIVVGLARRENRLDEIKAALPADQASRFHGRKCDVSDEQQVIETFAWVDQTLGGADVLVNNAGIVRHTTIIGAGNSADLRAILDTNVLGVSWCTREAFQSLERRKIDDGHVVIINSVAGHAVPNVPGMSLNMYSPSKHAITALTEVLRQEFAAKGTKTKITSVSPGAVDTEIIDKEAIKAINIEFPMLRSEDVADAVTYCIQTPPNVQIHELTIKPIGEKF